MLYIVLQLVCFEHLAWRLSIIHESINFKALNINSSNYRCYVLFYSLASSDSDLLRWEAAITKYRVKAKMNLKPFLRDESNDWQIFVNMYIQVLQPTCVLVGEGGTTCNTNLLRTEYSIIW